jgi:hypothetical protein
VKEHLQPQILTFHPSPRLPTKVSNRFPPSQEVATVSPSSSSLTNASLFSQTSIQKHQQTDCSPNLNDSNAMNYESKEEQIYVQASAKGISHDLICAYFDKAIDHITSRFQGKSADWRLEKAEQDVWAEFCK